MNPKLNQALRKALSHLFTFIASAVQRTPPPPQCDCGCCQLASRIRHYQKKGDTAMVSILNDVGQRVFGAERLKLSLNELALAGYVGEVLVDSRGYPVVVLDDGVACHLALAEDGKLYVDNISSLTPPWEKANEHQIKELVECLSDKAVDELIFTLLPESLAVPVIQKATAYATENLTEAEALLLSLELQAEAEGEKDHEYRIVRNGAATNVSREEFLANLERVLHEEKVPAPAAPPQPPPVVNKLEQMAEEARAGNRLRLATTEALRVKGSTTLDQIMQTLRQRLPNTCAEVDKVYSNGVRAFVRDYLYRLREMGIVSFESVTDTISFVAK